MHLSHDKQSGESETEHLPEIRSIAQCDDCSMNQYKHFLRQHPPPIYVKACQEKAALEQHEKQVEEAE